MNPRRSWLRCCSGSLALALLALLPLGPIRVFELATLDLRFRVRERWWGSERSPVVRTVVLDDSSLAAFSHSPVPYAAYASAVNALALAGPRVLGMDVYLAPSDSSRPREERDYRRLIAAVARTPHLVVATHPPLPGPAPPFPAAVAVPEARAYPWSCEGAVAPPRTRLSSSELPAQALATAATRFGFVQLPRDEDGVVRRVPLVLRAHGDCYPSFVLQVVCEHDGVLPRDVRCLPGAVELWRGGGRLRRIPVDRDGCLLVNYHRHPPVADLSLAAVASGGDPALLAPLEGQVVLMGTSARALGRMQSTPLAPQVADVHILGEAVETILAGRFLWPTPRFVQFLVNWAFLLAGALLMARLTPWRGVLVGLGLMALYFLLEKSLFVGRGVWLDFIGPMGAMQMAVVGFPLYSYRTRSRKLLDAMAELRRLDDSILSTMTSGLLLLDGSGRVVKSNARAARLLGHEGECLDGRSWRAVFDTNESALAALEQALAPASAPRAGGVCALPRHVPVVLEASAGDRLLDLSVSPLGGTPNGAPPAAAMADEPRWLLDLHRRHRAHAALAGRRAARAARRHWRDRRPAGARDSQLSGRPAAVRRERARGDRPAEPGGAHHRQHGGGDRGVVPQDRRAARVRRAIRSWISPTAT